MLNTKNTTSQLEEFIVLKENKALHKLYFTEILFVEAFGDYVKVHTKEKTITTHSTFSKFIDNLPNYFLRTHKSFSINLNRMNHLSGNQITLDIHTIPIGQTFKQNVLKALNL